MLQIMTEFALAAIWANFASQRTILLAIRSCAACILLLAAYSATSTPVHAQSSRSATEDWVVRTLASGYVADLSKAPDAPDDSGHKLSATFVEDLLAGDIPDLHIPRSGINLTNATISGPVFLSNVDLATEVSITESRFDDLTITHSVFKKAAVFDRSTFGSATFDSTTFTNGASFSGAQFIGPTTFTYIETTKTMMLDHAVFMDRNSVANFNSAKIVGGIFASGATFNGGVDFRAVESSYLDLQSSQSTAGSALFSIASITGPVRLEQATFAGPVAFDSAIIKGEVAIDGVTFGNEASFLHASLGALHGNQVVSGAGLTLSGATLGGDVSLDQLTATGIVDFSNAMIGGDLSITNSELSDSILALNVGNATIKGNVIVTQCNVSGPLSLANSEMLGLTFLGTQQLTPDDADFSSIKVSRDGTFNDARFGGTLFLSDASFGLGVSFIRMKVPPDRDMRLGGMVYRDIYFRDENDRYLPADWSDAKSFYEHANFWPGNYVDLETYFKRLGKPDDANSAFIEGKRLQRPIVRDFRSSIGWIGDAFLDASVCYGRCPDNVLIPSLLLILAGSCIFWDKDWMDPKDASKKDWWYNPFWYSLDLFAPVISLGARDVWTSKQKCRTWARWYEGFQKLAGWLLVPIGLAAVTGLLK